MLRPRPPKSNVRRQREFRERNPGYYGRLHRKRKAQREAYAAAQAAIRLVYTVPRQLCLPAPEQVRPAIDLMELVRRREVTGSVQSDVRAVAH